MTETKRYNGWTNYETWNVALWLGNEQGSSEYWDEQAESCWADSEAGDVLTHEEAAAYMLAERLKDEVNEGRPITGASLYTDLLGAALSEVNWDEIAQHYIDDVDKTETPEEAESCE